jgi:uncharacterized tellurite resistance protein B-like protein
MPDSPVGSTLGHAGIRPFAPAERLWQGMRAAPAMPLHRLLTSLGLRAGPSAAPADSFLGRLHAQLARLGSERLEYLAGFAGQLARVAHVEGGISSVEATAMTALLAAHGRLAADDAALVVDLLRHEFEVLRSAEPHVLNRAINAHAGPAEKEVVIDCLYAVAAADHLVSDVEEREIRRVAEALLVAHSTLMAIRARYRDRLEALRPLPGERR